MTFQYEDQVPRVHITYSIGTAYREHHQQIPEDKQEQVSLIISQYLQDQEYRLYCLGDTWSKTNFSDPLCLILLYYLGVW